MTNFSFQPLSIILIQKFKMKKNNFLNDYHDGGHPTILSALQIDPKYSTSTYGEDPYSQKAIELIRKEIQNPKADIHFVSGGTQANIVALTSMLKPYESVIAPESSHIHVHETGAIESTGHKINAIPTKEGKLTPKSIQKTLEFHQDEHMVSPRVVFISQSTELGTLYTYQEMKALSDFCKENHLLLYADGARIGAALVSSHNDITIDQFASLVDAFYIGGTKNGAVAAEAIVLCNPEIQTNFRYLIKQKGALLAKGRFLGIQFQKLFENRLFYDLAKISYRYATELSNGIRLAGYDFLTPPVTNQIFPILPNALIDILREKFHFYIWQKVSKTHTSIRLVTSWNTSSAAIQEFLTVIQTF